MSEKIYKAGIYARLSKDDGNEKPESDSITNQIQLMQSFVSKREDIKIVSKHYDDGFTGTNFDRPAFKKLLEEIDRGEIDCVIVKDFSRLGRNHTVVGTYIQIFFPSRDVRFIAVNENYDSLYPNSNMDNIFIPIKNLLNEEYSRDTSKKVKSQFEVKRKNGEFIGSFAVYGYLKSCENKNKLVVDEFASVFVKKIFEWKLEGFNNQKIADKLNDLNVLSPVEYKKSLGMKFYTPFQKKDKAKWSPVAVGRILKNEMYIGNMVQGKEEKKSFKLKQREAVAEKDWVVAFNTHEPIISKEDFETVKAILKMDTRTPVEGEAVPLFSGMIFCGDCGASMVKKVVPSGGKKYFYYICSNYKVNRKCSSHLTSEVDMVTISEKVIKEFVNKFVDVNLIYEQIKDIPVKNIDVKNMNEGILNKEKEVQKYNDFKIGLYEDLKMNIISEKDFAELKAEFEKRIQLAESEIAVIKNKTDELIILGSEKNKGLESFISCQNIGEITRKLVVSIIENIYVFNDKYIDVNFKYKDNLDNLLKLVKSQNIVDGMRVENG